MTNRESDPLLSAALSRRSLATAGAAAVVASATGSQPAEAQSTQIDPSPFYPAVTPGIDPVGKKIEPYTAACVQSPVIPTSTATASRYLRR